MVKTLQGWALPVGSASTANTTQYCYPTGGHASALDTTEANKQIIYRSAGVISNFYIVLPVNGITGTTTFTMRKSAADLTSTVSFTGTGTAEDTTHTDTIAAGDKIAVKSVPGGATGTFTLEGVSYLFAATTDTVTRIVNTGPISPSGASTTYNHTFGGILTPAFTGTPEGANGVKTRIRKAGTIKNLAVYVSVNSRTATTVKGRKNATDGTVTTTLTASTPGLYEDTTHSDTVAVGDDYDTQVVHGTGTSAMTLDSISYDFITTTGNGFDVAFTGITATVARNTTVYYPVVGGLITNVINSLTETDVDITARAAFVFSELEIMMNTNAVSSNSTLNFRLNAGSPATNLSVTITASVAGLYSDTTHTDTVVASDLIDYQLVVGVGSGSQTCTPMWIGVYTSLSTPIPQTVFIEWEES